MSSYSACPLCGRDKYMSVPKPLYGHSVCKKCVHSFANRRQLAWIIDMMLIRIAILATSYGIGHLLVASLIAKKGGVYESDMPMFETIDWGFFVIGVLLMLCKDGFSGRSPGKVLTGVQVINRDTGKPIDFVASILRNWPTLIPIMPLVCGVQLLKGPRFGDKIANTLVIWKRHADTPVFATGSSMHGEAVDDLKNLPVEPSTSDNPYEAPRF